METEADDVSPPAAGVVTCLEPHPSAEVQRHLRERCLALAGHTGSERDVRISCAPFRCSPVGAHIDHQGGTVAGFALNMGVCIAYMPSPDDRIGEIQLTSKGEASSFEMQMTDESKPADDWTAFVRGAVHVVREWAAEKGVRCDRGFTGVVSGCPEGLEGGGISSSAALTVALINAIRDTNQLTLASTTTGSVTMRRTDIVRLARRVEHEWRGVRCGILDQGCVVMSKPGALTVLDCAEYQRRFAKADDLTTASSRGATLRRSGSDDTDEETSAQNPLRWFGGDWTPSRHGPSRIDPNVDESGREVSKDFWDDGPDAGSDLPFAVVLAFSGIRKPLTRTGYNDRVDECQRAARLLLDASGRGVPRDVTPLLHMVTREEWTAARDAMEMTSEEILPANLARRARHFFEENQRVANGVRAWRDGDVASFGALVNASGASSVENYECGCEQITALWKIAKNAAGVFGARFSGAGFRGCVVALCEPGRAAMDAAESIAGEYARLYPELAADAPVIVTRPGRGAFILRNEDQ